ncbi:hypothetical protein ACIA58_02595 [Kribbella sp. NPDC051586]|uniref:hypothetical protein n=1 Tax=Kribbella sp. NPDC051586 TaxID=3364118 RepID=UPI00379D23E9
MRVPGVVGMELLGERPVRSMSDSEKLSGYATELGAGDTARLLTLRYRTDATEARRQVRLATHLTKYAATTTALPDPSMPFTNPATASPLIDANSDAADGAQAAEEIEDATPAAPGTWRVSPAQAAVIVSVLDQVPATLPAGDLEFAEQQLINLAATHTPSELRRVPSAPKTTSATHPAPVDPWTDNEPAA